MFERLFGKRKSENSSYKLIEPIFPEEDFRIYHFETSEGISFATINYGYYNYPNKELFPWCAQILLEYEDQDGDGHPSDEEAGILNELEDKIERFLKQKQIVHFIGRVTGYKFRDLIFYIDEPKLDQIEKQTFLDEINKIRKVNFELERDEEWKIVASFVV